MIENVEQDVQTLDVSGYQSQKNKRRRKNPNCLLSEMSTRTNCGKKGFYGCTNYPDCTFTLTDNFRKKKLTKTNVRELLQGKETTVKSIKNKNGKAYNAKVTINEKGTLDFLAFI